MTARGRGIEGIAKGIAILALALEIGCASVTGATPMLRIKIARG